MDPEPERDSSQWKYWIASHGDAGEAARKSRYLVTREEVAKIQRDYPSAQIVQMPRHGRVVRMPRCSDRARFERWEVDQFHRYAGQMLTQLALVSQLSAVPLRASEAIRRVPAHRPKGPGTLDAAEAERLYLNCFPAGCTLEQVRPWARKRTATSAQYEASARAVFQVVSVDRSVAVPALMIVLDLGMRTIYNLRGHGEAVAQLVA
jgi:hypothetical protein